jgi:multicomponent Na+:H+ antiporter subunit F
MTEHVSMSAAVLVTLGLLALGMGLTLIRVIRGPNHADRVVALDVLSNLVFGFIVTYAVGIGEEYLLAPAFGLSIVTFLVTVAFARYLALLSSEEEHE